MAKKSFKRVKVNTDIEKKIITGLIVDNQFCNTISPMILPHHIDEKYAKILIRWIKDYNSIYKKAPGQDMEGIYLSKQMSIDDAESDIIAELLSNLNKNYLQEEQYNWEFITDESRKFIRKKNIELLYLKAKALSDSGEIDEAEKIIRNYSVVKESTSEIFFPIDDDDLILETMEKEEVDFFRFAGQVGHILGAFNRGWFVTFLGPSKRCKCVVGSTQIPQPDGSFYSIEEMVKERRGSVISLHENTGTFHPNTITEWIESGIQKVYRVKTHTGREVTLTKEHPLFTVHGWKKLSDLTVGDSIAVPKQLSPVLDSDVLWDKIISIEYAGEEMTYDLSVETHHNFVANDIVVHNSWWLLETAIQGIMCGHKVAFFSLEMQRLDITQRILQRITGEGGDDEDRVISVWDCEKNKTGECTKEERTHFGTLEDEDGDIPEYSPDLEYTPCSYCMKHDCDEYKVDTWFETYKPKSTWKNKAFSTTASIRTMCAESLAVRAYPRFGAGIFDVENTLDEMKDVYDFIPDIIIIDYPDILNRDGLQSTKEIDKVNEIWQTIGRWSGERKALVVVAAQSQRHTLTAANVKLDDFAEDIRKLHHVDAAIGIHQSNIDTFDEIKMKRQRLSVLAHRHGVEINKECYVLQDLKAGQLTLDSYEKNINKKIQSGKK